MWLEETHIPTASSSPYLNSHFWELKKRKREYTHIREWSDGLEPCVPLMCPPSASAAWPVASVMWDS